MKLKYYVPPFIIETIRLLQLRIKFPQAEVYSRQISSDIKLGRNTRIGLNTVIKQNVKIGDYSYINDNTIVGKYRNRKVFVNRI